jgi:8-oxo-dGTP pyrophosphatase MutT (NUDIX family)
MHRRPLLLLLEAALARQPESRERIARTHRFVAEHPDCLLRSCVPGHVTGSAWIVSHDHAQVLLTHHRKLGRWLQLGGHADGDPELFAVALREAREESGLERFATLPGDAGRLPLDVDVHEIAARAGEPTHLHYDVRFLLLAEPAQELRVSDESHALRWVAWRELGGLVAEESLHRMARRARALLRVPPA